MQVRGRAECWAQPLGTWYPDPSSWATARPLSRPATPSVPRARNRRHGACRLQAGAARGGACRCASNSRRAVRRFAWLADVASCAQGARVGVLRLRLASVGRPRGLRAGNGAPVQRFVMRRCSPRNASPAVGRKPREPCKPREYWPQECWRSRPESNWGRRICNPLPNHLATGP